MLESGKVATPVSARLRVEIVPTESRCALQWLLTVALLVKMDTVIWRWGHSYWVGYILMFEVSKDMSLIYYKIAHRAACGRWGGQGQCLAFLSCVTVLIPYVGEESGHYGEADVQNIGFADLFRQLKVARYCWNEWWLWGSRVWLSVCFQPAFPYYAAAFAAIIALLKKEVIFVLPMGQFGSNRGIGIKNIVEDTF